MIDLNFTNHYKKIKIIVSDKHIEAIFSIKYSFHVMLKIVLFEAVTISIFPICVYFQSGTIDLSAIIIPTIASFIFLAIALLQKNRFEIYPFKNKVVLSREEIKLPKDYSFRYEVNYSSEQVILNVLLIAKSDVKKTIPIYAFPDLETFKTFREIYNSKFPSSPIQE